MARRGITCMHEIARDDSEGPTSGEQKLVIGDGVQPKSFDLAETPGRCTFKLTRLERRYPVSVKHIALCTGSKAGQSGSRYVQRCKSSMLWSRTAGYKGLLSDGCDANTLGFSNATGDAACVLYRGFGFATNTVRPCRSRAETSYLAEGPLRSTTGEATS